MSHFKQPPKKGKIPNNKIKSSPQNRAEHLIIPQSDGFYVLGGCGQSGPLSDIWKFSKTSGWLRISSRYKENPFPRIMTGGCGDANNIFILGGIEQDEIDVSILNDFWNFSIQQSRWHCINNECPVPERYSHVMINFNNDYILVHGGECLKLLEDTWIYSHSTKLWQMICSGDGDGPHPCARAAHSAVYCAHTNSVFLFGGRTMLGEGADASIQYLNDLWILRNNSTSIPPDSSTSSWHWQMVQVTGLAPSPRDLPALLVIDDKLFIMGGYGLLELDDVEEEEEVDSVDDVPMEEGVGLGSQDVDEQKVSDVQRGVADMGMGMDMAVVVLADTVPVTVPDTTSPDNTTSDVINIFTTNTICEIVPETETDTQSMSMSMSSTGGIAVVSGERITTTDNNNNGNGNKNLVMSSTSTTTRHDSDSDSDSDSDIIIAAGYLDDMWSIDVVNNFQSIEVEVANVIKDINANINTNTNTLCYPSRRGVSLVHIQGDGDGNGDGDGSEGDGVVYVYGGYDGTEFHGLKISYVQVGYIWIVGVFVFDTYHFGVGAAAMYT
eukprot:gene5564-11196_t